MRGKTKRLLCDVCAWVLACILLGFLLFFMIGCSPKVVTVERVRTDTTFITKWQRDSVWKHDSIRVSEKGDTIRIEKWHTEYIEKVKHDTTVVATHDTIPQPYPVIREVPADLTWWQSARIHLANIVLCVTFLIIGYYGYRIWRKIKI